MPELGDWVTCPKCQGSGASEAVFQYRNGERKAFVSDCTMCRGKREVFERYVSG